MRELSTKMIGESLEQHCSTEFNRIRNYQYPYAYFDKDNDITNHTKGDFIFRDFIDGEEYISIMFEMKNEADETQTKHKNEDFFAKLHKDRQDKGCEYAILVSLLEPDNDLYNDGIVNVSHKYDKTLVLNSNNHKSKTLLECKALSFRQLILKMNALSLKENLKEFTQTASCPGRNVISRFSGKSKHEQMFKIEHLL